MLKAGILKGLEHQIVFQGVVQHQAVLVPVFRDVAHARFAALADGAVGNVLTAQGDVPGGGLFKARQAVDQLRLTVAVDARDAHNLTGTNLEGDVVDGVFFACF